ncbi:MAG: PilZ domain-containing protein [Desulfobacterales bacterium]
MKRILIVDGDAELHDSFSHLLRSHGNHFKGEVAPSGEEALKLIESRPFDLLIADLSLPRMSGGELLTYARKKYPGLKLIAMRDPRKGSNGFDAASLGVAALLEKPLDVSGLTEKIFTSLNLNSGGQVRGIGLSSFLQMLELEEKSCTLKVSEDDKVGYIYMQRGQLFAAETGDLRGLEAAYNIIGWDQAAIEIDYIPSKRENEIHESLMTILMESQKRKDESESQGRDLRRFPRFNCMVAVDYDINDWSCQNFVRNISLGGAYIETQDPITLGEIIQMNFSSANLRNHLSVSGKVVRRDANGFGVQFESLNLQQIEMLKLLMT